MPNGPTTLGPRRICTAAQILRSARMTTATDSIKTRHKSTMNTVWLSSHAQPYGKATPIPSKAHVQNWISAILFRRHPGYAMHQFLAALGHGLARARNRVGQVIIGDPRRDRHRLVRPALNADAVPGRGRGI